MAGMTTIDIALVGYGEVGRIFAAGLAKNGAACVKAFDVKIADAAWAEGARARAKADGVELVPQAAAATRSAGLVVSAVTAAKAGDAANAIATACRAGALVLDVNSASPGTKRRSASIIEEAGAHYVEAAIMNAVPPQGMRVPMLLGGPRAKEAMPVLQAAGFNPAIGSEELGTVSAIKLCRSVVMKGIEALVVESLLAARRYGVEREVIASLRESYPGLDWEKLPTYVWSRVMQHGARRAEEMRESAVTVREAGVEPRMASATAELQAWFAGLRASDALEDLASDAPWNDMADRIQGAKTTGSG